MKRMGYAQVAIYFLFFVVSWSLNFAGHAALVSLPCQELLERLSVDWSAIRNAQELKFIGVGTRDVYNPTAPFDIMAGHQSLTVIAARVEARDQEVSKVLFFTKSGDHWVPLVRGPELDLQDPFVSRVGKDMIFGGVQTFPNSTGGLGYRTVFYRLPDLINLEGRKPVEISYGPDGMKDIRLLTLADGKILVATRPQGNENGLGRIGFKMIGSLDELNPKTILSVPSLPNLFIPSEWGGVNEMHILRDGRIGILGHIARFDEHSIEGQRVRHYYPMTFVYDSKTMEHSIPKILLQRSDLDRFGLSQESKRPDLADVLFSGGLVRRTDGTALLFLGAGDARVVQIELGKDPFLQYEER